MPEPSGRDLLHEWRELMDSLLASVGSIAGRPDLARQLLEAMERQLALMGEIVERERRLQKELASRVMDPVDAVFDLLEASGGALRSQAEALEAAGSALEETAALMKGQAELFEQTIGRLREPARLARSAAGLDRQPRDDEPGGTGQHG